MMVHNFATQHLKITYIDQDGKQGYLQPGAFLRKARQRWSVHPDMMIQYAKCLQSRLEGFNINNASIYFDVWKSMNKRVQQRMVDPRIDLAHYKWSVFEKPQFILPIISELSGWRSKLEELKQKHKEDTLEATFIADFPGLLLENYIEKDYDDITLEVLNGDVLVSVNLSSGSKNTTLSAGERLHLPSGVYHTVYTLKNKPSVISYVYFNSTERLLEKKLTEFTKKVELGHEPKNLELKSNILQQNDVGEGLDPEDQLVEKLFLRQEYHKFHDNKTMFEKVYAKCLKRVYIIRKSALLSLQSIRNVFLGKPSADVLESEGHYIDRWPTTGSLSFIQPQDSIVSSKNSALGQENHKTEL